MVPAQRAECGAPRSRRSTGETKANGDLPSCRCCGGCDCGGGGGGWSSGRSAPFPPGWTTQPSPGVPDSQSLGRPRRGPSSSQHLSNLEGERGEEAKDRGTGLAACPPVQGVLLRVSLGPRLPRRLLLEMRMGFPHCFILRTHFTTPEAHVDESSSSRG